MTHSTIYWMNSGYTAADGVQSQAVCNATINTARRLAAEARESVIVEDHGTRECYRVTPAGHIWRKPKNWMSVWEAKELGPDYLDPPIHR